MSGLSSIVKLSSGDLTDNWLCITRGKLRRTTTFAIFLVQICFFLDPTNSGPSQTSLGFNLKRIWLNILFNLLYNQILFKLDDQKLVLKLWYRGLTYINLKTKYSVVVVIQLFYTKCPNIGTVFWATVHFTLHSSLLSVVSHCTDWE